jgi:hypothetical protein
LPVVEPDPEELSLDDVLEDIGPTDKTIYTTVQPDVLEEALPEEPNQSGNFQDYLSNLVNDVVNSGEDDYVVALDIQNEFGEKHTSNEFIDNAVIIDNESGGDVDTVKPFVTEDEAADFEYEDEEDCIIPENIVDIPPEEVEDVIDETEYEDVIEDEEDEIELSEADESEEAEEDFEEDKYDLESDAEDLDEDETEEAETGLMRISASDIAARRDRRNKIKLLKMNNKITQETEENRHIKNALIVKDNNQLSVDNPQSAPVSKAQNAAQKAEDWKNILGSDKKVNMKIKTREVELSDVDTIAIPYIIHSLFNEENT